MGKINNVKDFKLNILTKREKYRKEQHVDSRIIFYQEILPVQLFQNVMNDTAFIYKNRALEGGRKVIHRLKGIRGRRSFGIAIQWVGFIMLLISSYIIFVGNFNAKEWNETAKIILVFSFFFGFFIFPLVGGIIRASGKKLMADYVDYIHPMEINRLVNGQLVLIKYRNHDKSCGEYKSALKMDGKIGFILMPTYVEYVYVIDGVKSCKKTKKGILLESSGRFFGARNPCGSGGIYEAEFLSTKGYSLCFVFAESHVSYRKELIPDIFTNMDQLEAMLMSYGSYDDDRYKFYPL